MRDVLRRTFSVNLASGSRVSASGSLPEHSPEAVLDSSLETYWSTGETDTAVWIELQTREPVTCDRAMLQEAIQVGQRVEQFRLEAWSGNRWVEFARGTTIGHKRLERFPRVRADRVRLVIERSRSAPAIATFGLFRAPGGRSE
jgi:alpha-L-fucosidase